MKLSPSALVCSAALAFSACEGTPKHASIPTVDLGGETAITTEGKDNFPENKPRLRTPSKEDKAIAEIIEKRSLLNLRRCLTNNNISEGKCSTSINTARTCDYKEWQQSQAKHSGDYPECKTAVTLRTKPKRTPLEEGLYVQSSLSCDSQIESNHPNEIEARRIKCQTAASHCIARKIVTEKIDCKEGDFNGRILFP